MLGRMETAEHRMRRAIPSGEPAYAVTWIGIRRIARYLWTQTRRLVLREAARPEPFPPLHRTVLLPSDLGLLRAWKRRYREVERDVPRLHAESERLIHRSAQLVEGMDRCRDEVARAREYRPPLQEPTASRRSKSLTQRVRRFLGGGGVRALFGSNRLPRSQPNAQPIQLDDFLEAQPMDLDSSKKSLADRPAKFERDWDSVIASLQRLDQRLSNI